MWAARIGALAALIWAGCVEEPGEEQSFPEAMQIFCDTARLTADLAALAEARWPGGLPPTEEREIILQAAPETPFQTVVDLMVATRARTDGRELFSRPVFGKWAFD